MPNTAAIKSYNLFNQSHGAYILPHHAASYQQPWGGHTQAYILTSQTKAILRHHAHADYLVKIFYIKCYYLLNPLNVRTRANSFEHMQVLLNFQLVQLLAFLKSNIGLLAI